MTYFATKQSMRPQFSSDSNASSGVDGPKAYVKRNATFSLFEKIFVPRKILYE